MTAKDLLHMLLDYRYLWQERGASAPGKARLVQIASLSEALGLTKKNVNPSVQVKYLVQGEFLNDRQEDANSVLEAEIRSTISILFPDLSPDLLNKPVHIAWLFHHLLNFRQAVYQLTYPQAGMLEGFSAGLHYSFYLEGRLKKVITDNLAEIDDTLWLILDPLKRSFSKEEIGFPECDLDDLDREWSMENY